MSAGPSLEKLLRPRSVAIVGASPRAGSAGSNLVENLQRCGFQGAVYPVNPRYPEIHGVKAYPSLGDMGASVDAVFIAVAAEHGPEIVRQALAAGAGAILINATGYADGGADGQARQAEIAALATAAGVPICGPNNLGLVNIADGIALWTSGHMPATRGGPVAVVSQSGSVALTLGEDVAGIGIGYLITAGNEAVTGVGDYVEAIAADPRIETILLFLETIRNPARLAAATARARKAGKSVLAMKIGRSATARAAVAAHSGALSGEDAVVDAFFRKHGILRARDLDDLVQIAKLKRREPPAPGARAAYITLSGGEGAAVADAAEDAGIPVSPFPEAVAAELAPLFGGHLPPNPCDAWGLGWDVERVGKILDILAASPEIDPIAFTLDVPSSGGADGPMAVEMARIAAARPAIGKKALFVANSAISGINPELKSVCDANGLLTFLGMGGTLRAMAAWTRPPAAALDDAEAPPPGRLDRAAFERGLREGIRFVESRAVTSAEDAVRRAERLGYPVVLKGIAPEIAHKSELGLVKLNLRDARAVTEAFDGLSAASRALPHAVSIEIEAMMPPGVELLVAARRDPTFGPVVIAGIGGTLVELVADSALRVGVVSEAEALDMLSETRAGILLDGFRQKQRYDRNAAAAAIATVSRLMAGAGPDVTSVEINPVIVLPEGQGAIAVDLLIE